ncbi:hypothetical protein [Engelhardtia mirabilis]|uniref:Uncharacterized protein n=1 Tax=Engelhardtia mirabilis TaxID=2528011 RepID=A0A518BP65_9BACT|nr:hypothetical protein Pla133_38260 [Planctomycetes bacterium Pla133]QDV03050.1 hypothetical protein Pla86_38250 [Planctomycetes bacterium Pla86]
MTRATLTALSAAVLCVPLALSAHAGQLEAQGLPDRSPDLTAGLATWRAEHGPSWHLRRDAGTGHAAFLFGGSVAASTTPRVDGDYVAQALGFLESAHGLLGVDLEALGEPTVTYLPLSFGGSSDKVVVSFGQVVDGIPVRGGKVNVLLGMDGTLLALDSTGLPNLSEFSVRPTVSSAMARAAAVTSFVQTTGLAPTEVGEPRLVMVQEQQGKLRAPVAAWELDLRFEQSGAVFARRYAVAAEGSPRLVVDEDLIHFFDVGGQVLTNATPGTQPDSASNPEVQVPAAYMRVDSSAGSVFTDQNGFFNFPGVSGPLNVTFQYEGSFNDVFNDQGAEHVITQSLSGTGNTVLMNPTGDAQVTSQSNVFVTLNAMRDWIRSLNPTDGAMDFVNNSEVNEDFTDFGTFTISNCNAFYDGSSTNYFLPGGGCVNTAYSTVIAHEQGHWLNDRYGSFNGSDGFGEGNADVFAMYLFDTPIVGSGFSGGSTIIRSGENTLQYCGDGNGGCYGAVHTDGQVHMGAMWKVRRNLQTKYGTAVGGLVADQLLSGWMNGYDQGTIDSVIEIQLLTLDDNDGNIDNGTPNYAEIDGAFLEQGFPGYELSLIAVANLAAVSDSLDEAGPYGVAVVAASLIGGSLTQVELKFDAGAGVQTVAMSNNGGATYAGLIPGVPSPAQVDYWVEVTDNLGNTKTWPEDGAAAPARFTVGQLEVQFSENFDGPTDNGWTHAQVQTQDDWQRGVPGGKGGVSSGIAWNDPDQAVSGLNVWGNDLGPDGFNGAYQPDVINFLRSPLIDLSGANGATLRFQRWLTVEEAIFDQAQIRLNGATVWENPQNGNLVDTAWTNFELDISSADGDPSVELEFRLESDGGLNLGGWNIDDLEIFTLNPSPSFCQPSIYGAGVAGLGGQVPTIDAKGQPAQSGNTEFVVAVKNGRPQSVATIVVGLQSADIPALGGSLLVLPILTPSVLLDVFGQITLSVPLSNSPGLIGQTLFVQAFVTDAAAPEGFSISPGFAATICN